MTLAPLHVGIAGLGTVGQATAQILISQAELLSMRAARRIILHSVSARDKHKKRDVDVSGLCWHDDPLKLANDPQIHVVIELIGGDEGVAKQLVETALKNGKHVVTANKALIAKHGVALAQLAEKNNVTLAFEAAVAGGIPVLKLLRQGLSANNTQRVAGILNGTCNYILTHMRDDKRELADVLAEAQQLGYAEAEPSFDIDGIDTAHKLAILTSLAYGVAPDLQAIHIEGIRAITLADLHHADELGYTIKLLGITARNDHGISQRVHPCLVEKGAALASVQGVFNAITIHTDSAGPIFIQGRGAGGGPTASAVIADIMDVARSTAGEPFGVVTQAISNAKTVAIDHVETSYYVRLSVLDKPGVLAEITSVFRDSNISLKSFLQHGHAPGEAVSLIIATHAAKESAMKQTLATIAKLASVVAPPFSIRIENL